MPLSLSAPAKLQPLHTSPHHTSSTLSSHQPLTARQLFPVLMTLAQLEPPTLSTQHFEAAPASIALAEDLRVGFCAIDPARPRELKNPSRLTLLTHDQLDGIGLTALQAWERARINVYDAVAVDTSARLFIRDASYILGPQIHGIQLRADEVATSTYLTHPLLFGSLHRFVCEHLATPDITYFCPERDVIVAIRRSTEFEEASAAKLRQTYDSLPGYVSSQPFYFGQGFPRSLRR